MEDNFKVEIREIPINEIVENKGQIPDVPKNPRKINKRRFEELKESIQNSPEMKKLNEVKVLPFGGKYIVIGGNMRLKAYRELGYKKILCKVLPEDTKAEKIREYIIQDNNEFGENDLDVLAECWNGDELSKWNIDCDIYDNQQGKEKVEGDVDFTEVLNEEHNIIVLYFDNNVDWLQAKTLFGIKQVKCLSTRSDGKIPKGREKYAVGRVLSGPKAINAILKKSKDENIG
jgi:uncharacterized ParB-like nuclease family protein